jgi:acyl-coenzyme A synthetase/AMP-(fatty) acid ligase/thioesterase domain-containing protein/acyl carrier protein
MRLWFQLVSATEFQDSAAPAWVLPSPSDSFVTRWRAVVAAIPEQAALTSPGSSFTFAQVDQLSDVLATELIDVLADTDKTRPVALLAAHNAQTLIALIAIIKAGRVSTILDPYLPAGRLEQICTLATSEVCLTDARHAPDVGELGGRIKTVLRFDEILEQAAELPVALDRITAASATRRGGDAFNIVFTSGSTGVPKGVVMTHGSLLNDAYGWGEIGGLRPADRMLMVMPFAFAAGFGLSIAALTNGVGLWCYDPRDLGVKGLAAWIVENELTFYMSTPHLARSLLATLSPGSRFESIRLFSTVGEAVQARDVEAIRPYLRQDALFVNCMGSSESSGITLYVVPADQALPPGNLAAGQLMPNKTVRLYREDRTEVTEPGEAGEIVVTSRYLSAGYWRNPETTAERFTAEADGQTSYRQGDLGRFDEAGVLSLLGRIDAAIKVRGFLVEPSEIESALLAQEGVTDVAVVAVTTPGEPSRLVSYVAQDPAVRTQSAAALRRQLRVTLPEYMVPSAIVLMSELPHNERGKIDRQMLPPLPHRATPLMSTDERERVMSVVWAELLGLEAVGVDEDFMALGADSLLVEELLAVVEDRFGAKLNSSDLLAAPTLREFTRRVARLKGSGVLPSHPDIVTLQAEGAGTPVFCFAGGGGLALSFLSLSKQLDSRPVYSFQAHGLERRGLPDYTIEAYAERYLQLIRVIQPHGPYVLLGHSFGGLVALEVARRLRAADETVGLLGLLDTFAPSIDPNPLPTTFEPVPGYQERHDRPARVFPTASRYLRQVVPDKIPGPKRAVDLLRAAAVGPLQFEGSKQFLAFFDHSRHVAGRFRPQPTDTPTLLVFADSNTTGEEHWRPYFTGEVIVEYIASEHTSMLRPPHVLELATMVRDALHRAHL